MDNTIYVSPTGVTREVATPEAAVNLRGAGWWPQDELEAAAEYNDAARQVLAARDRRVEERTARQQQRAAGPAAGTATATPTAMAETAQTPAQEPAQTSTQTSSTKTKKSGS